LQDENAKLLSEIIELRRQEDSLSAILSNELVNIKKMNTRTQNELKGLAVLLENEKKDLQLQVDRLVKSKKTLEDRFLVLDIQKREAEQKLRSGLDSMTKEKLYSESKYEQALADLGKQKESYELRLNLQEATLNNKVLALDKERLIAEQKLRQEIASLAWRNEDNLNKAKLELAELKNKNTIPNQN